MVYRNSKKEAKKIISAHNIEAAILNAREFPNKKIGRIAKDYEVSPNTLRRRLNGSVSKAICDQLRQKLTVSEEAEISKSILELAEVGCAPDKRHFFDIVDEFIDTHILSNPGNLRTFSKAKNDHYMCDDWMHKFRERHPELKYNRENTKEVYKFCASNKENTKEVYKFCASNKENTDKPDANESTESDPGEKSKEAHIQKNVKWLGDLVVKYSMTEEDATHLLHMFDMKVNK